MRLASTGLVGFNSRLREEATGCFRGRYYSRAGFNSRLREEATCAELEEEAQEEVFQLTPP